MSRNVEQVEIRPIKTVECIPDSFAGYLSKEKQRKNETLFGTYTCGLSRGRCKQR